MKRNSVTSCPLIFFFLFVVLSLGCVVVYISRYYVLRLGVAKLGYGLSFLSFGLGLSYLH